MTEGTHLPGLLVVLEDLEVEEDDEGEGEGDCGDEPVPGSTKEMFKIRIGILVSRYQPRLQFRGKLWRNNYCKR